MTSFYRVRLGAQGSAVDEFVAGGSMGVSLGIDRDLSTELSGDDARSFNARVIPEMVQANPRYTRIGAGMRAAMLWTACRGINEGDVIISPNAQGLFHVGLIAGPYRFSADSRHPHQRPVQWRQLIARSEMGEDLRRAAATPGTIVNVTPHAAELEGLMGSSPTAAGTSLDPTVEDATAFALEKHLEDFLVANWAATELGKGYRIFEADGERVGQQFPTDTGPIDILAISNDGTGLLVVELKRGRASDVVVGQIQRYMGYVAQDLAEPGQTVRGVIIAFEDDLRIRRALAVATNIDFYRYSVRFQLHKA